MIRKSVKKKSQKQESSVAKEMDARTVVASGALWGAKGDVRNDRFLIECKTTEKDFYTITAKVWEKIQNEATKDNLREPLLIIDLHDSEKERYVCFPYYMVNDIETPQWLKCNIETARGESKQFRFYGVRKHCATVVQFQKTKKKYGCHTVVLMTIKDFKRLCDEKLFYTHNEGDEPECTLCQYNVEDTGVCEDCNHGNKFVLAEED